MLQAFIITLREGVEAALIVGHHSGLPGQDRPQRPAQIGLRRIGCGFCRIDRRGRRALPIQVERGHLRRLGHAGRGSLRRHHDCLHDEDRPQAQRRDRKQSRPLRPRRRLDRPLPFRLSHGVARGCRNRSDSLRRNPELQRTDELHRHGHGDCGRHPVRRDVRQGQRQESICRNSSRSPPRFFSW